MTVKCEICGKEFSDKRQLALHLKLHNITSKDYYIKYFGQPRCYCGNETKFISLKDGFREYCSTKCMANSDDVKNRRTETSLRVYGETNPAKSTKTKKRMRDTCFSKFGGPAPIFDYDVKGKIENTNLQRYNHCSPFGNSEVRIKSSQTMVDRHGTKHNFCNGKLRTEMVSRFVEKYGCENPSSNDGVKSKRKKTNIEKFGVDNPTKNPLILKKIEKTNLKKYGTKCVFQNEKIQSEILTKKRNAFVDSLFDGARLGQNIVPLFDRSTYTTGKDQLYKFKCNCCGSDFESVIRDGVVPRCYTCYPILSGTSYIEEEIYDFVKQFDQDVVRGDRSIIHPFEIDIVSKKFNVGIELNGLYWHSEISGNKGRKYHLNKTNRSAEKGIKLIHIFEDEWVHKQEIVKNRLSNLFTKTVRVAARNTEFRRITESEGNAFFERNHLQGKCIAKSFFGLFDKSELVSVISIGKNRFKKGEVEIVRYASTTSVIGGLSKLIKNICKTENLYEIVTFCDRRFSDENNIYSLSNFELVSITNPSYFYTDFKQRFNRLKFQKHKLPNLLTNFSNNLSEWENMQNNGYDRIWDCGTFKYKYTHEK